QNSSFFFFFQAEDGIRDRNVTGVQTCALPISTFTWGGPDKPAQEHTIVEFDPPRVVDYQAKEASLRFELEPVEGGTRLVLIHSRSEERRVGKECRARWGGGEFKERESIERRGV